MKDNGLFNLQGQYHCCWCPGDARGQGIKSNGIDLVISKYSGFSSLSVNMVYSVTCVYASVAFWFVMVVSSVVTDCPLQWRHNGSDGVSNHQPHGCLLNRLFRRRSKKTSKLRVTGLCVGNSPVTGEFPAQMASNVENISIWWRHHEFTFKPIVQGCFAGIEAKIRLSKCQWDNPEGYV